MSKPIHPDDGTYCPQWRKPCVKVCHTCKWYKLVRGKHPQTGADVDEWDCAIALLPMLQIENAMVGRQTTATVDALRNEVNQANSDGISHVLIGVNKQLKAMEQLGPPDAPKLIEN